MLKGKGIRMSGGGTVSLKGHSVFVLDQLVKHTFNQKTDTDNSGPSTGNNGECITLIMLYTDCEFSKSSSFLRGSKR